VASLCTRLGSDLVPADGFNATPEQVTAVHISELLDPTGYLTGGELLLTTGLTLPSNRIGCERYVGRLKGVGVSALAIGLGPVYAEPPEALAAACRKLGLTLLTVPAPTPFLTITKAYWAAVSSAAEQQLKDVLAFQRALVEAAASSDTVAGVLRVLVRWLGGWAATFTPQGDVDQIHPIGRLDDAARIRAELSRLTGVHSAASFSAGAGSVVVYPLAVGERIAGYLAVGSPRPLDPDLRRPVLTATALLSIDAVRRRGAVSAAETGRRCVAQLVDLGHPEAARRLAAVIGVPAPADTVRVLVVRSRDSDDSVSAVRDWCDSVLSVTSDRQVAWFLVPADHPPLERLDAILASDATVAAVMSDLVPVTAAAGLRALLTSSVGSLTAGTRLLQHRSPFDTHLAGELSAAVDTLTAPQLAALVGYLRHRGQWEVAARALGIHRNTLRHRVARCRDQLPGDLEDPDVAAELWLVLRRRGAA
jgi:purine catabolism regulator